MSCSGAGRHGGRGGGERLDGVWPCQNAHVDGAPPLSLVGDRRLHPAAEAKTALDEADPASVAAVMDGRDDS